MKNWKVLGFLVCLGCAGQGYAQQELETCSALVPSPQGPTDPQTLGDDKRALARALLLERHHFDLMEQAYSTLLTTIPVSVLFIPAVQTATATFGTDETNASLDLDAAIRAENQLNLDYGTYCMSQILP